MTRNLKVLGLALVAVFAMSAVAASGASATAAKFKAGAGTGTTTITGEEDPNATHEVQKKVTIDPQLFETDVGPVECNEVSGMYSGAAEAAEATFTEVSYTGECNTGGLESEIDFNGCDYKFHAGTKNAGGSVGTADIECPIVEEVEQEIEVIAAGGLCTVFVNSQAGLGPITYTNVAVGKEGKEEITLDAAVTNIEYSWVGPLCGEGEDNNGIYTGKVTARAETTAPGLVAQDLTIV